MNKVFKYILLLFFFGQLSFAPAQRINNFNLYPLDEGISVNFDIGPGPDCSGYTISHCLDSMSYNVIYDFAGICGTSGTNEPRSYLHTTATKNVRNYYKIQLYPYDVAYKSVLYNSDAAGSLFVYPNPVYDPYALVKLKLSGVNNITVEGFLCSEYGTKLRTINATTQGEWIELSVTGLQEGVYLLWLSDGATRYSTKFIVLFSY